MFYCYYEKNVFFVHYFNIYHNLLAMHHEYVFKFIRHMAFNLILAGILSILVGILILIYPMFLTILVSALLIVIGLLCLKLAHRINKYSKVEINI